MNSQRNALERDMANLIAKHSDWLDGEAWMTAAEHIGRGYFDDMPDDGMIDELCAALKNAPPPKF